MPGPYKKKPKPRKDFQRIWKTKRRERDIDEIHEDMKEENAEKLLKQEIDYDKPGAGQNYCLHCARYFVSKEALSTHFKTKGHKKRLRELAKAPYSQEEAERAAGKGSFFSVAGKKVLNQPFDEDSVALSRKRRIEMNSALVQMERKRRKVLNDDKDGSMNEDNDVINIDVDTT